MAHFDLKSAVYWATIAAGNGSISGQYSLGYLLINDTDPKNRRRAVYWLKRVANSNDKDAAKHANFLLNESSSKKESEKKY
jgi:TPR repeat protein